MLKISRSLLISKSVGLKVFPAFYQSATQHIFDKFIKHEHPFEICANDLESHLRPLTSEECCALRYVAGYTFRKMYSSLDLSTHPQKDVMMCLLMELVGDGVSSSSESERWMGMINRGGLWTINDQAYDIFLIMEEEIRKKYTLASNKQWCASTCSAAILRNDDLRFQWYIVAAAIEHDSSELLLQLIVDLYVTVHGFAFATSCLEIFKQAQHKTMKKTRSLRSELCPKQ